jgi:predicted HD phosphohydrolase
MTDHLNEMRFFLEVIQAYSDNCERSSQVLLEQQTVNQQPTQPESNLNEELLEDLTNLKEKFLSVSSNARDSRIDEGFEIGMYKAVEMLENLLSTKYNRRI